MNSKIVAHSFNGNLNFLSDNSYLAIKPEATVGTAVVPSIFVPLVSESIKTVVNQQADRRMKGVNWKATDLLRGLRSHEGDLVVLCDPDTLGHVLNMVMTKGSTTGTTPTFTHPFTVGTPKTYTIEISKGSYVQRYFGVTADQVKFDFSDGKLQATISVKCMGQVSIATLGVTTSGAVTTLVLDDEYDIAPTRGLVAGDVLDCGGVACTITAITNDTTLAITSATVGKTAGQVMYLKPQSVTLATLSEPLYFGNLLAGFGASASAAATASATRGASTALYDLSITIKNNVFSTNGSTRFDPVAILQGTKEAQIALKQLFTTAAQRQAWQDRIKQSIVFSFLGKAIATDMSTQESFTLTFNNVKLITDDNEIKVGEYIMDDESFEALYDSGDAAAMSASLVNRSAGTVY